MQYGELAVGDLLVNGDQIELFNGEWRSIYPSRIGTILKDSKHRYRRPDYKYFVSLFDECKLQHESEWVPVYDRQREIGENFIGYSMANINAGRVFPYMFRRKKAFAKGGIVSGSFEQVQSVPKDSKSYNFKISGTAPSREELLREFRDAIDQELKPKSEIKLMNIMKEGEILTFRRGEKGINITYSGYPISYYVSEKQSKVSWHQTLNKILGVKS